MYQFGYICARLFVTAKYVQEIYWVFFICSVVVVLFFLSQFRKLTCNVRAAEEGQKIEQKTEEGTQTGKKQRK